MKSDYVIWRAKYVPNVCALDEFKGVDKQWEFSEGVPRASTFPEDAVFTMDPDSPYDTLLADNLPNTKMLIVGSRKLKEFIEEQKTKEVEYLPVTILDHRGRVASRDYFIIHPIRPVDCLNLDECGARWSSLDETSISRVKRLVINESKINRKRVLFRAKYFEKAILVRRNLAEAIDAKGFTGIRWVELTDY